MNDVTSTPLRIKGRILKVSMKRAFDNCYHLTPLENNAQSSEHMALRMYWDVNDNDTDVAKKSKVALPYTLFITSASPAPPEGLLLKSLTGEDGSNGDTAERYKRMGFALGAPPEDHDYWSDGDSDEIDNNDLKVTWDWSFWTKHSAVQTFALL
jgi:hypothetical protein